MSVPGERRSPPPERRSGNAEQDHGFSGQFRSSRCVRVGVLQRLTRSASVAAAHHRDAATPLRVLPGCCDGVQGRGWACRAGAPTPTSRTGRRVCRVWRADGKTLAPGRQSDAPGARIESPGEWTPLSGASGPGTQKGLGRGCVRIHEVARHDTPDADRKSCAAAPRLRRRPHRPGPDRRRPTRTQEHGR